MSRTRLKGLVALVAAAVEHGSAAIEKVQLETAGRTFDLLEKIPPVAIPAKIVHVAHDVTVKTSHGSIRLVTALVKGGLDVAIDVAASRAASDSGAPREPGG